MFRGGDMRTRKATRRALYWGTSFLAAGLTFGAVAASAQTVSSEESLDIQRVEGANGTEIIVTAAKFVPDGALTATKTDVPLIETPQSVSVVTRDQMDLLNFIDTQQAVRYTAGVSGENYGPDLRFNFVNVRGFTPKEYVDGLAAPISTSIFSTGVDLYAFQSLDILKGPASVLYGNSPPGGIYNLTSRRAGDSFDGEIRAQYGTDDYKDIAATITDGINDNFGFRVTALYRNRDAERDFVSAERILVAPTVKLSFGNTTLTGLYYYQYDKVRGDTNGFLPVFGTLLPNPKGEVDRGTNLGDPDNLFIRDQMAGGIELVHEFSPSLSFRTNVKISDYAEDTPIGIYGGGGLVDDDFDGTPDDFRTVQQYNFSYREDVDSIAVDSRLAANLLTGAIDHRIIGGVDYRTVDNDSAFGFIFANRIDLFDPQFQPQAILRPGYPSAFNNQEVEQTGVYLQDIIGLGNFNLTLSGRYDWIDVDNAISGSVTEQDKFTYRVGANYVFESGIAPYASYATSFEPVIGTDSVTGDSFVPSEGKQYEAGIKYDGRGLNAPIDILATVSAFMIEQTNVVQTAPAVTPVFGTQVGEVEVKGVEFELVSRIDERLTINASYSYLDSEVTESTTAVEVGAPLPVTPKHKASAFVDYTFARGALAGFGAGAGVRYSSESAGSLPGPFNPVVYFGEDPVLFDATVHYNIPGWRLQVNASNLFDEKYVARCASAAGCTYGAGRQIIGTVTKLF